MTTPLTDAEALSYIASYADLRAAFGADAEAGRQHFQSFGQAEGRAISFAPLFYTAASPDLIAAFGTDAAAAARHFIQYGADEGRTVRFDALSYIASNPDLIQAFGIDAAAGAEHYIRFGLAEQRPTARFDALGYTAANPDLLAAFGTDTAAATRHFVQFGVTENRPMQFDAISYLAANPDLLAAFGTDTRAATDHYVRYGAAEQRPVTFGALEYLASNPDLMTAFGTDTAAATRHYVQFGSAEGRSLVSFDAVAYLLSQPDLRAAGLGADGALAHWVNYGFAEGRSGDATFGREQGDHALAVGQTVSSSIDGPEDRDWFRIDVTQGQQVKMIMTLADAAAPAPRLHLYDTSGYELSADVTTAGGVSTIAVNAKVAGTLYLATDATAGYQGAYSLQASTYLIQLVGTSRRDGLFGVDGATLIQGLGGDDVLVASSGGSVMEGGAGNDQLTGGAGDDVLYGNHSLNDTSSGGLDGADYLKDEKGGNDRLYGQDGDDTLVVTRDRDVAASTVVLDGGSGDDIIAFYSGSSFYPSRYVDTVTIQGGTGNDTIFVGSVFQSFVDAGEGEDRVTITLTGGSQTITLGSGADVLTLDRTFDGVPSSALVTDFMVDTDRLNLAVFLPDALQGWDPGSNPFAGGYLTLVQSGADTLLRIDRDGGGDDFTTLLTFSNTTASSFTYDDLGFAPDGSVPGETIIGTPGDDTLTGRNGDDLIQGLDGNDVLEGLGGDDVLEGGRGSDRLNGGAGNDILYGNDAANSGPYDAARDFLTDTKGGDDQLFGQDGADDLRVVRGNRLPASTVLLDGGADNDSITFLSSRHLDTVTILGGSGNDRITMTGVLRGVVDAAEGNDDVTISPTGGTQTISLGSGQDVLRLHNPYEAVVVGAPIHVTDFEVGTDTSNFDSILSDVLQGWDPSTNPFGTGHVRLVQSGADALLQIDRDGGGDDFATLLTFDNTTASSFTVRELGFAPDGAAGVDQGITGTSGDDVLTGLNGNDHLRGLEGDDVLEGRSGDDVLEGGDGIDRLNGGLGIDILYGDSAADGDRLSLWGDKNYDFLTDDQGGNDQLFGQQGHDSLRISRYGNMSASSVLLDGGTGYDTISFSASNGRHLDTVTIFGGSGNDYIFVDNVLQSLVDAGEGDDTVNIALTGGTQTITLGQGQDVLILSDYFDPAAIGSPTHITDFTKYYDRVDIAAFLDRVLIGWDGTSDPVEGGYLDLIQSGADTLLRIDLDGGGDNLQTLLTFNNTEAASFSSEDFGYYGYSGSLVTTPGQGASGEVTEVLEDLYAGAADATLRSLWNDGSGAFGVGVVGLGLQHAEVLL